MNNSPIGSNQDPRNPINEIDKDNHCMYCGETCQYYFCNKECKKAYDND